MSNWIEVTDKDCIDLSDDGTEINILYSADKFGNSPHHAGADATSVHGLVGF